MPKLPKSAAMALKLTEGRSVLIIQSQNVHIPQHRAFIWADPRGLADTEVVPHQAVAWAEEVIMGANRALTDETMGIITTIRHNPDIMMTTNTPGHRAVMITIIQGIIMITVGVIIGITKQIIETTKEENMEGQIMEENILQVEVGIWEEETMEQTIMTEQQQAARDIVKIIMIIMLPHPKVNRTIAIIAHLSVQDLVHHRLLIADTIHEIITVTEEGSQTPYLPKSSKFRLDKICRNIASYESTP